MVMSAEAVGTPTWAAPFTPAIAKQYVVPGTLMEVNVLAGKDSGTMVPGVAVVLGIPGGGSRFVRAVPAAGTLGLSATATKLLIAVAGSVATVLANAAHAPPGMALSRK